MGELRPRALTRGEMKALRKDGINLGRLDEKDVAKFDDVVDRVLETQFPVEDIDPLPNDKALKLFSDIVGMTYGAGEAEKNLSGSGAGSEAAAPEIPLS